MYPKYRALFNENPGGAYELGCSGITHHGDAEARRRTKGIAKSAIIAITENEFSTARLKDLSGTLLRDAPDAALEAGSSSYLAG
jgi:hypothetical protein